MVTLPEGTSSRTSEAATAVCPGMQQAAAGERALDRPWLTAYEPGVPATISYPEQPLFYLLHHSASRYPQRPALIFYGRRISYRALDEMATRFAASLISIGVRKGDRVAIHLPNSPQFVLAYYGALRAGAVVVALSPLYTDYELRHQIVDSGASTIVTLTSTYSRIKALQAGTTLENVIVTNIKEFFPWRLRMLFTLFREAQEGHRVAVQRGDLSLQQVLQHSPDMAAGVEVSSADLALLQYTGGTTGLPKAVMLTHRALMANVTQCARWNTAAAEDGREVVLAVLPFYHLYAQQVAMNQALFLGGALILLPRFERRSLLTAIDRHRPTLFPGVTTLYVKLMDNPDELRKHDLHSIKLCLSGAMALPQQVQERFEAISGGRMIEGYGMTEAAPLTHATPVHGKRKIGSIGVPVSGTDAIIVSVEDGKTILPAGQVGEICVRGPQLMQGYWNRPEETAKVLRDGWLHTGDLGKMDTDGFFFLVDRIKDMIISGGFKIFPREVEEVLYAHPAVEEAAVVGIKDAQYGELPKAFVVVRKGCNLSAAELVAYCRDSLAIYKVPAQVEFRSELPKSAVGKILKRELLAEPTNS